MADYEKYVGKYTRASSEKFEEFLAELGLSWPLRKAATASTPTLEVTYDSDKGKYQFKTSTLMITVPLEFQVGVEFDETTPDGRKVRSIVTKENDSFIAVQTAQEPGKKSTKIIREFKDDQVIITSSIIGNNDLVCLQTFKKVK